VTGRWASAAIVFVLALLAYLNNLGNGFVYDDRFIIQESQVVQELDWASMVGSSYWGELVQAGLYRPLTLLSFGLNRAFGGPEPFGFHLVNNFLHATASVVVFYFAIALGAGRLTSLSAGVLFAVHPIHAEAVNGIVGRAEIFALLFLVSALLLFVRGRGTAVAILLLLALLSKESAAFGLPLFFLLPTLTSRRVRWADYWPLAAALTVYLGVRVAVLGGLGLEEREIGFLDNPAAHASSGARLLTAPVVFLKYMKLLIAPIRLSADYSFSQIPLPSSLWDPRVWGGTLVFLGLVCGGVVAHRRGYGLLAFAIGTLCIPILGLVHLLFPLGTILAERLAYLPSLGVCLIGGLAIAALRDRSAYASYGLFITVLAFSLVGTVRRNQDWLDNETLFGRTVATSPASARSHFLLGTVLAEQDKHREAAKAFRRGLSIAPGQADATVSLGQSLFDAGDYGAASAAFEEAAALDPELAAAHYGLGVSLYKQGRLEEAVKVLEQAVGLDDGLGPTLVEVTNHLGIDYGMRGDLDEAEAWHRRALELEPNDATALNYLGVIEERRGNRGAAKDLYARALSSDPDYVPALLNLGSVLMVEADLGGAESRFRRAAGLAPGSYEAHNSLGIVLARLGRDEEAAQEFRTAISIDPELAAARENLAALGFPQQ
jgi:tetratricopeptide (TPR) repeat protein